MSATINPTGHSQGITRSGPMGFAIGAILVVSVAAGGFAIWRASSDQQAVAAGGGSVTVGAVHPERGTIVYRRTAPAIVGESGGLDMAQPSDGATRDRQRHHPKQTK